VNQVTRRKRAARGTWLVAILVVVVGSLLPAASLPMRMLDRLQVSDKIQHFGAYAVLAFLPAVHERWKFILVADFAADAVGVCGGVILAIPLRGAVRSLFGIQPDSSSGNIDYPKN
jgi:hypothetical protein